MNIYEMFCEHWKRPGYWIRRTSWGNTIAKVVSVGELCGRHPYYGNPEVVVVVYDIHTGEVKGESFVIPTAGTGSWRWVHPPAWSTDLPFDPKAGRVILNVPFGKNAQAQRLGARWSHLLDAWWIAQDDAKAFTKAKALGFMEPVPSRVSFFLPYEQRQEAKNLGARYEGDGVWSIAVTEEAAVASLRAAGFQEHGDQG